MFWPIRRRHIGTPDGIATLGSDGKVPAEQLPAGGPGATDHGALTGLADDDHSQYHTDARGDARYYTETELNAGQLDTRYFTESEVTSALSGKSDTGHTHSGVYQPVATVLTNTTASFTTAQETKLSGIASGAEVNVNADWTSGAGDSQILNKPTLGGAAVLNVGTTTGTVAAGDHNHSAVYQPLATVLTNTTASFTTAQETKLSGIAAGATANSTDLVLLGRANHTGTQAVGTITGLATVATSGSAADLTGNLAVARLNSGTGATASTFWCGDNTWKSPGGGSATGVLLDLQMSILQSDGTLNAALGVQTWAGTNKTAQDVFTVVANSTYRVRGQWFVNTGATTHTTAMAFALATATATDFQYQVMLWSAALNTIATVQSTTHVTGVASKVLNATSTAVYTIIKFEGIMVIGTGGTVTPQINFSANPTGTNLMKRGSWTSFERLGADTITIAGGWV